MDHRTLPGYSKVATVNKVLNDSADRAISHFPQLVLRPEAGQFAGCDQVVVNAQQALSPLASTDVHMSKQRNMYQSPYLAVPSLTTLPLTPPCQTTMIKDSSEKKIKVPSHRTDELFLIDPHTSPIHMHQNHPKPHIHRLPVELLQQIFFLIVNDMPRCPDIFSFDYSTVSANFASPPLIFTRVCHLWREAAYSTTGIWSRINVMLPGGDEPLQSFLPCLLQRWLALSGSQPLTIHINQLHTPMICRCNKRPRSPTLADFTLLYILYSESRRWETLIRSGSSEDEWFNRNLDTPQLRTLECAWSDVARFNAPSLRRLHIVQWLPDLSPIPTCKNVRHLHLSSASPQIIRSTSMIFPLLETITVDQLADSGAGSHSVTHSCLESMTLPLSRDGTYRPWFIEIFDGAHLPKLQKLNLVGHLRKFQVDLVMDALAVASCNVQAVDFCASTTQDEVDMNVVESLLSVVRKVSLHGKVLRSRAPCN